MKKIILSEVILSDSNVFSGGGTVQTQAIQKILNTAVDGGLYLVVDGAYVTGTLRVYSHTTIECLNENCGFFLKEQTNGPLIVNAHSAPWGERADTDICFIGGTYNFNCKNQERHKEISEGSDDVFGITDYWTTGFNLFGIRNLRFSNVVLRNQRTYALACGNAENVTMENIRIDLVDNMFGQNQDGLHFFGESKFITLKNIRGNAGDDFIAFAADEHDGVSSITDVLIDGVQLRDSDQAIRLLSHGKGKLDRIFIRNVTGTFQSYGFFINPWLNPAYKPEDKYGNFGHIRIENVMLKKEGRKYDYTKPHLFRLGGMIKNLEIENIFFENVTENADFMQIGGNYIFFDRGEGDCKTEIERLSVKNVVVESGEGIETLGIVALPDCKIENFEKENIIIE